MSCDVKKKKFISYEESLEILENIQVAKKATQKLYLTDAIGYVLAKDIIADHNSPEYPTSAMDGYAIKHKDIDNDRLEIIDLNPAGKDIVTKVKEGTCIKTFTGSLMPEGSDTLVPIENITKNGLSITIGEKVPKRFATRAVGENYKKGEVLIKEGTKIGFAEVGIMASLNIVQAEVYVKPVISIASTGSEILDLGEKQTNKSQIRSSNHLTLEAIAKQHGADVLQKGVVKDDRASIENLMKSSLESSDIVVTTGGVSVGDYDFVKDIIKEKLDATLLFQGVNIKPGQHIIVAQKDDKFIVGLPGFAYSSTVTFLLYVLPLLFKLKGAGESLDIVDATIKCNYPKKANKTIFSASNVKLVNGEYFVDFEDKKSGTSAILTNMLGDVGLLVQEENSENIQKGDKVKVILL
jgi:molybdopterin molybdotransferase